MKRTSKERKGLNKRNYVDSISNYNYCTFDISGGFNCYANR